MQPGISLTYDDMSTLAQNLGRVIEALQTSTATADAVGSLVGDDSLSATADDFSVRWAGERNDLIKKLTGLQSFIRTIISEMQKTASALTVSVPTPTSAPSPGQVSPGQSSSTPPRVPSAEPLPSPRPSTTTTSRASKLPKRQPVGPPPYLPGWPTLPGKPDTADSPYPWKP